MCTDAAADLLSCLWFNVETKQVSFAPHLWGLSSLTAPLKGDMSLTNSALLSKQRVVKHMIGGSLEETWSQAQSAFASAQQLTFSFAHSRHGYRWTQKDKATHMCEHPRVASTCSRCCRDSVTHMGSSERECVYIVGACVRSAIGEESAGFNEPFVQQWGRSDVWICSPRAKCAVGERGCVWRGGGQRWRTLQKICPSSFTLTNWSLGSGRMLVEEKMHDDVLVIL